MIVEPSRVMVSAGEWARLDEVSRWELVALSLMTGEEIEDALEFEDVCWKSAYVTAMNEGNN